MRYIYYFGRTNKFVVPIKIYFTSINSEKFTLPLLIRIILGLFRLLSHFHIFKLTIHPTVHITKHENIFTTNSPYLSCTRPIKNENIAYEIVLSKELYKWPILFSNFYLSNIDLYSITYVPQA